MHYKLIYTSLLILALLYPNLQAQVSNKSYIRNLPEHTEVWIQQAFDIPALKKSILVDNGDGKICSCQFFTQKDSTERIYEQGKLLRIRNITIKGLFDGSQMHVARVYFEHNNSYFKFKCYSREITIKQLQDYITIRENSIASEE